MITYTKQILEGKLNQVISDLEQVGREIYYALAQIKEKNPAEPAISNLNLALKLLGISRPEDVGLSSSLFKKDKNE